MDVAQQVRELTRRVQALEDERAICRTLVRYGFAVDSDDPEATAALYTRDCVITIDRDVRFTGSDGVRALVSGELHQAILPNCAHMIGPLVIDVDGDDAVATGYACVVVRTGDDFRIWREGANRWELERDEGAWRIRRRTSFAVGSVDAQRVLNRGI
jgi:ketosteroid isomerase-like protein